MNFAANRREKEEDCDRSNQAITSDRPPSEKARFWLCCTFAFLAPQIAAAASFAILRTAWAIGGPKMMTTAAGRSFWRIYEYGVLPANVVLGSVAALLAVLFLHPETDRRWRVGDGVAMFVAAPFIFMLSYLFWERLWRILF